MNYTEDQIRDRKVLIKSWKSIKKITNKTTYGGRTYSDNTPVFSREMKPLCNSVVKLDADSIYDNFKIEPWMIEAIICDDAQLKEATVPSKYVEYKDDSIFLVGYRDAPIRWNVGKEKDHLKAGRYRKTGKFANEHFKTQNEMMRLGALVEAVTIKLGMEDWVADWDDRDQYKYCVNICDNRYVVGSWVTIKIIGAIYIPEKVAERVCEILNSKEYEL
jgi:hypothetical protein